MMSSSHPPAVSISPFRILLVFACPPGSSTLRLQNEERLIRESLKAATTAMNMIIDVLPACTTDDLSIRLLQNRNSYDLIHFSGHADRTNSIVRHLCSNITIEHGQLDEIQLKTTWRVLESMVDNFVRGIEVDYYRCSVIKNIKDLMNIKTNTSTNEILLNNEKKIKNNKSKMNRASYYNTVESIDGTSTESDDERSYEYGMSPDGDGHSRPPNPSDLIKHYRYCI